MINSIFNSQLLATARNYRGLSQTEVAKRCGMSQPKYSKIENGVTNPTEQEIEIFSERLNFPPGFFGVNTRIIGVPMSFHEMHRSPKSVGQKEHSRTSADLTIRIMCIAKLMSSVELEPELTLPQYDADDYGNDGAEIARMVRQTWMLPSGPIANLTELAEQAGIIVFPCHLPAPKIDGVTVNIAGLPPVIFLNDSAPADRTRFSLAHELGHVVMHRQMSHSMEIEANDFAAEFLMPAREMKHEFSSGVTLKKLAELKRSRRVSMQALLYRAKSLDCINKNQSDYLWRQLNYKGFGRQEPQSTTFAKEAPSTLRGIIDLFMNQMSYSIGDISSMFCLNTTMVKELFASGVIKERKLHLVV